MEKTALLLKGLDCPNCAQKIADRVGRIDGVEDSNMNFMLKKLTVTHDGSDGELLGKIEKIVHKLEPEVEVKPYSNTGAADASEKKELLLEGLDCPHCAQKIADRVGKLEGVKSSDMNFVLKKLTVVFDGINWEIDEQIEQIVHKLEPDVLVKPFDNHSHHHGEHEHCHDCEHEHHHEHEHCHDCEHEYEHHHGADSRKKEIFRFSAATVLFVISFIFPEDSWVSRIFALCAYGLAGFDVLLSAVRNLFRGEAFDETLLMTIATVGAIALKDFREGAAVMLFFQWGELMQNIAVDRSKKSITKLMELKPQTANVIRNGKVTEVSPESIKAGEIIVVKAGETIPLDGEIIEGESELDCSALTGESLPVEVKTGAEVLSGSSNLRGVLKIKTTRGFSDSAVAKILDMVQNSSEKKAKTEKFITRFARVYTPAVVAAAALVVLIPSLITHEFTKWLYRGLLFLVISCPCALVISVPLSFFCAIGAASSKGILIKGAKIIEALSACKTLAADKTGTLTQGKFTVARVEPAEMAEDDLMELAAYCESGSNHPIAKSICTRFGKTIDSSRISNVTETAGGGISCLVDGKEVICAKAEVLKAKGIAVAESGGEYTEVCVCADGKYAGRILLGDEVKATSKAAVEELSSLGVETVMLTGDKNSTAEFTAKKLGIKTFFGELLPENKVEKVEELIGNEERRQVAFAGDGINDAPVIARSDIGIAMGGLGSDIAIEAADAVLMNDDIKSVATAVKISRKAMKIVKENIVFALGVKLLVMILGTAGLAGMWAAVFADVGVSALAVLNALRAQRV